MKKGFYASVKNKAAVAGVLLMTTGVALADPAADAAPAIAAIDGAKGVLLLIIAAGGAAMIAIATGKVAWTAGAKFVSRLAGRT